MDTCAKWDYDYGNNATVVWGRVYLPPITERLNKLLPGVGLVDDNTHGALYACAYDLAAYGTSPWCDVFTLKETEDFEYVEPASPSVQLLLTYSSTIRYELDLLMDGAFGYNLPDKMGPTLGALYVNTLIER
jgi:acid phosphatase